MKKLKVYKLEISPDVDDTTGVSVISLVNDPAIMKNFIAFSKDVKQFKFAITDSEKQIVTGPIMIPDLPIYRNERDSSGKIVDEWYVQADKDVISSVIQKFFKTQRNANASLEHNGCLVNGVYLIESFQVDSSRGIPAPIGYGTIPEGTWFGSMKVEHPDIWAEIKAGTFNGFSIEGLFTYADTSEVIHTKNAAQMYSELVELLNVC